MTRAASRPTSAAPADDDRRRLLVLVLVSGGIAVVAALVQAGFGAYGIAWGEAWKAVFDPAVWGQPRVLLGYVLGDSLGGSLADALGLGAVLHPVSTGTLVVWNVRLPRVLIGALVGVDLAFSGTVFQAITRNELASPYILGVSSGAGLTALLVLTVFPGATASLPVLASLGGAAAFLLAYGIAWKGGTSSVRLVLAGVIVGTIGSSLQMGLFFLIPESGSIKNAMAWITGSLIGMDWGDVRLALPWTLLCVLLTFTGVRQLDLLLLGDAGARARGMSVERVRFALAAVAILAASTSICVAGTIGFVGLIVPHIVRNTAGGGHARWLVGSLCAGPALMLASDTVARLAFNPMQLPVGLVTGLLGGIYFLVLMRRKQDIGEL